MKRRFVIAVLVLFFTMLVKAQDRSPIRFGKIVRDDFETAVYTVDSSADAVILADVGSTEVVGNDKGGFSLEFKRYRKARILHKSGYELANVSIVLYAKGNKEEQLMNLKAVTYNMEQGRVVESKLDNRTATFGNRIDKNNLVRTFTFPNVKEGSIIEYQYTLKSDFTFNLQPWEFQGKYPVLWSEYKVSVPEFYYYVTLTQGYQPFFIKEQKSRAGNFIFTNSATTGTSERTTFSANITDYRWVMRDVPPLKEEMFTSAIGNHISKIQFQLAEYRYPYPTQNVMGTWEQACEELLKAETFGASLDRDNSWLNEVMASFAGDARDELTNARHIYNWVRDNITCTDHNSLFLQQPLKNVLKNRNGNVAEVNLLLIAMLRKGQFDANPVMLSTRSHGYSYPQYPVIDRFNYVIVQLNIDGTTYYLDASQPMMGFGKLNYECYNGHARVINEEATAIELIADSLVEKSSTSIFVFMNEKGSLDATVQHLAGYFESLHIRDELKDEGRDQLVNAIRKSVNGDVNVRRLEIDSIDKYDEPVSLRYSMELKTGSAGTLYLDPMFGEGYEENPFQSRSRYYPVEMPFTIDDTYSLQMSVPEGYEVEELPSELVVRLNESDDGLFEYRVSKSPGMVSLRTRLRIKRAYFQPDEYDALREFFRLVVKKHHEQLVFKKVKK